MKSLKKINFLSIVLTLTMLLFLAGCRSQSSQSGKPRLKVGMECAYAPFNWIQPYPSGDAVSVSGGWYACGYDVYIATKLAKLTGKELEIIKVDWDGLLPALTSGKIDVIIAGMSATEKRRQAIDFTDKYYTSNIVVVMKKDSKFSSAKSINDFAGAKVTGQLGTIPYDLIDQMNAVEKQTAMEDFSSIISSLNAKKIDCYVCEKAAALTATHMNPNLKYIEFERGKGFEYSEDEIEVRIGVRKENTDLKNQINEALKLVSEEERNELMEKAVENSCIK